MIYFRLSGRVGAELTIKLAADFLRRHGERRCSFEPVGVAQGWSPVSYASSVTALQDIGYERIALGGLAASEDARDPCDS